MDQSIIFAISVSPEDGDFAEDLEEGFLGDILGLGCISNHAKAQRVNSRTMLAVNELKCGIVTLLGALWPLFLTSFSHPTNRVPRLRWAA